MSASFVQSFHVAITLRERWRSEEGNNLLPGMRRTSSALTRRAKKEILRAVMTTSSDSSSSSFSSSSSSSSETPPLSIKNSEEEVRKKVHARVARAKAKAMELAKTKRTRGNDAQDEEKEDEEERNAVKTASSKRVLAAETLQKSLDLLAAKGEEEEEEEDVDARRKRSADAVVADEEFSRSRSESFSSDDSTFGRVAESEKEEAQKVLVEALEAKLAEREENVNALERKVEEMEMEFRKASEALRATQKELEEKESKMQEERDAREEKEVEAFLALERTFQLEMGSLKKELESSERDAETARAELEDIKRKLEMDIAREKEVSEELRKKVEELKVRQSEDASGEVEKKIRENAQLTAEINVLKDKVAHLTALESEVTRLKEKETLNASLENEIEKMRVEIANNKLNDSDAVIDENELSALVDENASLKEEIGTLKLKVESLQESLKTTKATIDVFQATTERFDLETSELMDERETLVKKIVDLERMLQESIEEQKALQQALADEQEENTKLVLAQKEKASAPVPVASSSSSSSLSSTTERGILINHHDENELRRQGVPVGEELDALTKDIGDRAYKKLYDHQAEALMIEAVRIVDARNTAKDSVKKFDNAFESVRNVYACTSRPLAGEKVTILYNRKQLLPNNSAVSGEEKAMFAMVGYNGWSLQHAIKVDLQPIENFHSPPKNHDQEKCEWWEFALDVPSEAMVIDFVVGDSKGKFDNNNGKDYHIEAAVETDEIVEDNSREAQIEREYHLIAEKRREKNHEELAFARKCAESAVRAKAALLAKKAISCIRGEFRVFTDPLRPKAGERVTIRYRPDGGPLTFARAIYVDINFNRTQNHPAKMEKVNMRAGLNGGVLETTIDVPLDAHVVDFSFRDNGIFVDDNEGADYHCDVIGASGIAPKLRIAHLAVEMAPIAKVGGLGDVVTALSRSVQEQGHHVDVYVPKYDCMNYKEIEGLRKVDQFHYGNDVINIYQGFVEGVRVTFIDPECGHFRVGCIYGRGDDHVRFGYFSDACVAYMKRANCFPDVLHVHDWQTAPAIWSPDRPKTTATALTIHNLQFGQDLIRRAMIECTFATTVSPTYAEEIKHHPSINVIPENESTKFKGIRNGIDNDIWDPSNDEFLPLRYDWQTCKEGKREAKLELLKRMRMDATDFESKPIVACVTRLTEQKGVHLIKKACRYALEKGAYFVLLGSAPDDRIANDFANLANEMKSQHPGRCGFFFSYDEPLSHLIYAGADIFCVPSIFEPCGLTQMIAMRYGAVPLVRRTGGLRDTVFDVQLDPARAASYGKSCNGYNFDGEHEQDIEYALKRALGDYFDREKWNQMNLPSVGMRQDWSWTAPSERYIDLYWNARRKANRQQ